MTIGVIAKLKVILGRQTDFELAFSRYQNTVRAQEKGNLLFALHKSRDVVGDYVVMEQYLNDEALLEHRNSKHYKAIRERMGEFMAGPHTSRFRKTMLSADINFRTVLFTLDQVCVHANSWRTRLLAPHSG